MRRARIATLWRFVNHPRCLLWKASPAFRSMLHAGGRSIGPGQILILNESDSDVRTSLTSFSGSFYLLMTEIDAVYRFRIWKEQTAVPLVPSSFCNAKCAFLRRMRLPGSWKSRNFILSGTWNRNVGTQKRSNVMPRLDVFPCAAWRIQWFEVIPLAISTIFVKLEEESFTRILGRLIGYSIGMSGTSTASLLAKHSLSIHHHPQQGGISHV